MNNYEGLNYYQKWIWAIGFFLLFLFSGFYLVMGGLF